MEDTGQDICRVCRCEGSTEKPLFHPCVCTGSIKFIHQECLTQWLKYSRKEYCELCKYRYSFTPIYSPDMPKRLPVKDIISGLLKSVGRAIRYWFHYTLVAIAWLGIVPLTACRIYRCLFTGSLSSLLTLPLDMLSTENLLSDCFQGCFVVTCTLCAFISLVWLREQILHGGGPDWLENDIINNNNQPAEPVAGQVDPAEEVIERENVEEIQPVPNEQEQPVNVPENQAQQQDPADVVEPLEGRADLPQGGVAGLAGNLGNAAAAAAAAQAQDDNWNPIEWDRAAEELTWERLLGLDGSLVFLEHVFWVVSLNTLFILVFAFCPYHIGHFIIIGLKMESSLAVTQFDGLMTALLGYLVIAMSLVMFHTIASFSQLKKFKRLVGLCYVVVKVSLLVVVEIGLFPLVCGWWLDICSLSMFDAAMKDREASFRLAPGTSMFIHWLVGMVYVFYFASFILLLREVLRPGVLWFLRNLNDPDFNPIQEMIHLPIYRHLRRFLASMVIFGTTVLVMLWLPIKTIRFLMPTFLPYNVMLSSDAPVSELSLELLLLQVVLPALLEQGHTRLWLKNLVRGWCVGVAWILNMRSYLLGDIPLEEGADVQDGGDLENIINPPQAENQAANDEEVGEGEAGGQAGGEQAGGEQDDNIANAGLEAMDRPQEPEVINVEPNLPGPGDNPVEDAGQEEEEEEEAEDQPAMADMAAGVLGGLQEGLGAAHQAMLQGGGPIGFQPYMRPSIFALRLICLIILMKVTLFFASFMSLTVPVYIGRGLMSIWMGQAKIHELYTAGCGLYTCWLLLRASTIVCNWAPQGWGAMINRFHEWSALAAKSIVIASLLIGVVPLLLGLLFELVVVAPLRVPIDQTPVFFPWQDWALGVLHAKIICAVTLMGPQWWLKRVIEQVYNQGLRQMNLGFILTQLCIPVITCLALCLAIPYVTAKTIVPLLGFGFEIQNLVLRRIYPFLLTIICFVSFCAFQTRQFKRLYEHIKNDKYLVGQRLVNYERRFMQAARGPRDA